MNRTDYVLGIGGLLGHDANAALFKHDTIIASSQEERFTRIKHDAAFPSRAVNDCLKIAGIQPQDVSVVVFAEKPLQNNLFKISKKQVNLASKFLGKILPHHLLSGTLYIRQARTIFPNADFKYA